MRTEDFDFELDESLIAQHPEKKRENCRLMVMDRATGELEHRRFYELGDFLRPGDCLIMNDTRVLPARLYGARPGCEESIEVLLLRNIEGRDWECLVRPGKKMKENTRIAFSDELSATVIDILDDGQRVLRFEFDGIFEEILDRLGNMPLPPYITEKLENKEDYQTVYARVNGSAAAPTAGLHFSEALMDELRAQGVSIGFLTLHVGLGTFRPVKEEEIENHKMHSEFYVLSEETAALIRKTKAQGGRIITVGTTSTRTLESVMQKRGEIVADSGWTSIFIYPGYTYRAIDGIITNFHLPKSTLIMMISAFAGREHILNAYRTANELGYRFFSFGDAMLIADRGMSCRP
ncbi:MAG: tRNA preQ1(34) S-adenosylmethionine ribosyltransferase-isomerase QueA [Ndongobacter sp.]|nr:tRNA preQ1(34) S-adenosylmethionine ribosyltransferase-isomerase QueA [Ndongobacter sp.]